MTYRTVNSREALQGPHGLRYVHDAARPWLVLVNHGPRELCVTRYSTEKAAKAFIRSRLDGEPRTAAGSLD